MPTQILGVTIDNYSKKIVLDKINSFLKSNKQHYIVTPNPEFLVAAHKDNEFKKILNNADLAIPDGTGLIFASWLNKERIRQRITGTDLIDDICKTSLLNNYSIYLLGGDKNIAHTTAIKLKQKYKNIKIVGAQDGMKNNEVNLDLIKKVNPDILLVAFGQVKQEKWIKENLAKLPFVKLAIGVGGAFDYISGNIKRAPNIMRRLGLEWLYRIHLQPTRGKRIFNALIKFPSLVIIDEIKKIKL